MKKQIKMRTARWAITDGYGNPDPEGKFLSFSDAADDGSEVELIKFFRAFPNGARCIVRGANLSDVPLETWTHVYSSR
jgi:hypothetical protein